MYSDALIRRSLVLYGGPLASDRSVNGSKLQKAFRREFHELQKFLSFVEERSGHQTSRNIWLRLWADMQDEHSLGLSETVSALSKLIVLPELMLAKDPSPDEDPVEYWLDHLEFLISISGTGCET